MLPALSIAVPYGSAIRADVAGPPSPLKPLGAGPPVVVSPATVVIVNCADASAGDARNAVRRTTMGRWRDMVKDQLFKTSARKTCSVDANSVIGTQVRLHISSTACRFKTYG